MVFHYCALNIDSNIEWFRIPLFEKINENRFKIDLKPPLEIPLHISGYKNSVLRFDFDENFNFSRFHVKKRAYVRLEFEQPKGFKELLTVKGQSQKLFLREIDKDPRLICSVFDEHGEPYHKLMLYLKVDYKRISDRLPEMVNVW